MQVHHHHRGASRPHHNNRYHRYNYIEEVMKILTMRIVLENLSQ